MRVLVACESSQEVTKALRDVGVEAYSNDILPTEGNPAWHLQGDVFYFLRELWGMIIAFPPCTRLCVSGSRWWKGKEEEQKAAIDFFMQFVEHPCKKKVIENPIGIMSRVYRKPDQIIQPYMFGHTLAKSTCLWLFGLPKLKPTNIVEPQYVTTKSGRIWSKWFYDTSIMPYKIRGKERSRTFHGIALAMAEQWGNL